MICVDLLLIIVYNILQTFPWTPKSQSVSLIFCWSSMFFEFFKRQDCIKKTMHVFGNTMDSWNPSTHSKGNKYLLFMRSSVHSFAVNVGTAVLVPLDLLYIQKRKVCLELWWYIYMTPKCFVKETSKVFLWTEVLVLTVELIARNHEDAVGVNSDKCWQFSSEQYILQAYTSLSVGPFFLRYFQCAWLNSVIS